MDLPRKDAKTTLAVQVFLGNIKREPKGDVGLTSAQETGKAGAFPVGRRNLRLLCSSRPEGGSLGQVGRLREGPNLAGRTQHLRQTQVLAGCRPGEHRFCN